MTPILVLSLALAPFFCCRTANNTATLNCDEAHTHGFKGYRCGHVAGFKNLLSLNLSLSECWQLACRASGFLNHERMLSHACQYVNT